MCFLEGVNWKIFIIVRLGNKEFYSDKHVKELNMGAMVATVDGAVNKSLDCGEAETKHQIQDEILQEQLERLWKTDLNEDSVVSSRESLSNENKRAQEMMKQSLKVMDGHYQVAMPWHTASLYLPNIRSLAEQRAALRNKHLLRDKDLFSKYKATVDEYIKEGHVERVPLPLHQERGQ